MICLRTDQETQFEWPGNKPSETVNQIQSYFPQVVPVSTVPEPQLLPYNGLCSWFWYGRNMQVLHTQGPSQRPWCHSGSTPSTILSDQIDLIHFSLPTQAMAWARKHGAFELTLWLLGKEHFTPLHPPACRANLKGSLESLGHLWPLVWKVVPIVSFLTRNYLTISEAPENSWEQILSYLNPLSQK